VQDHPRRGDDPYKGLWLPRRRKGPPAIRSSRCRFPSVEARGSPAAFLPQIPALRDSYYALHALVGLAWYRRLRSTVINTVINV
jgi:hypothetical protein